MNRLALFAIGLVVVVPLVARGQEAGSIEAYQLRVRAQQQAIDQEISIREREERWGQTQQLQHKDGKKKAAGHHDRERCLNPNDLRDGQRGYLDYYILTVFDIAGPSEVFLTAGDDGEPFCLRGTSTKGLVNDQSIVLIGGLEVSGTKTYETTGGGSNTIRVVKFVDHAEIERIEREQAAAAKDALYRTWTSKDGKYKTEAKFVKYEKGIVHLQNRDGKVIELKATKLSRDDQRHFRELVKESRKSEAERALESMQGR